MPAVGNDQVEFGAKIPRELYDEFKEQFPQYGAVAWWLNTALESFLTQIAEDPTTKEQINAAILSMLRENRGETLIPTTDIRAVLSKHDVKPEIQNHIIAEMIAAKEQA